MPLILPSSPPPAEMSIGFVRTANDLSPAFAGADQQLRRKGSRYALTYTMPSMSYVESLDWTDLAAEGVTVVMDVHQPGLVLGDPGAAPLVKGAGQAGALLLIDGVSPGYAIRKGQFFSVISAGQRFLYRAQAATVATGEGAALVALDTMLRRPPNDNDVVELLQPRIEGFVRDYDPGTVGVDHEVIVRFTIRERE